MYPDRNKLFLVLHSFHGLSHRMKCLSILLSSKLAKYRIYLHFSELYLKPYKCHNNLNPINVTNIYLRVYTCKKNVIFYGFVVKNTVFYVPS